MPLLDSTTGLPTLAGKFPNSTFTMACMCQKLLGHDCNTEMQSPADEHHSLRHYHLFIMQSPAPALPPSKCSHSAGCAVPAVLFVQPVRCRSSDMQLPETQQLDERSTHMGTAAIFVHMQTMGTATFACSQSLHALQKFTKRSAVTSKNLKSSTSTTAFFHGCQGTSISEHRASIT